MRPLGSSRSAASRASDRTSRIENSRSSAASVRYFIGPQAGLRKNGQSSTRRSSPLGASPIFPVMGRRTVYRSRGQQLVFLGLGLFFAVFAAVVPIVNFLGGYPGLAVFEALIFGGSAWFFLWRWVPAGVYVDEHQIRVRNVRRTIELDWVEIERFRVGAKGFCAKIGIVELRDGTEIGIWGIQGPNPDTRPNNRDAEKLIERLNSLLADCPEITERDVESRYVGSRKVVAIGIALGPAVT
jgi:hypothetical protein